MSDSRFSVLKYNGKTPMLAQCLRCELKFLTPTKMMNDSEAAIEYLLRKYDEHRCKALAKDHVNDVAFAPEFQTTRD